MAAIEWWSAGIFRAASSSVGVLDLPGDQSPQGGLACAVGFLGIGPGRAEDGLGRVVVLELGQSADRGDADPGLGVLRPPRARRRGRSRRRCPAARRSLAGRATAFSRFQAAARALATSGLSLAVLASARAASSRPSTHEACSSWNRFSVVRLLEVELLDQPALRVDLHHLRPGRGRDHELVRGAVDHDRDRSGSGPRPR